MIHVKVHKQLDMFNPFAHLGPRRHALLESSWAHLFREEMLHNLPAEKLFQFYDEFKGRKTKDLCATLGLVLIQQIEERGKKHCTISYDAKSLRLSRRRARDKEKTYTEKCRYRSVIEGTMSGLD